MLKAIACVLWFACVQQAVAETVPSLDQIPKHLKTPQARHFFSEQIEGKAPPDKLGVRLPDGLTAKSIADMLVPASDTAPANLAGAKPWPGHLDQFVAIVCTGGAKPYTPKEPRCAKPDPDSKEPPQHVYLGVIEIKDGAPRLLARSSAIDGATRWADSGLARQPMDADDAAIAPDSFDSFDFAPYKIAKDQTAFGLRAAWTESYSGGGAYFTALCLFAVQDGKVKSILTAPMSAYADVAGDWHKDGTRDHHITDEANVVIVSQNATDGHFDLLIKNKKWRRVYKWSAAAGGYRAASK